MPTKLHGRATTTPAIRKAIQESKESILKLAKKYGINHNTVQKWKKRTTTTDQKCGRPLRSSTLTIHKETAMVAFRKHTKLPLDDCLFALKKQIHNLSRSSLYRCLKRHDVNQLPQAEKLTKKTKKFKTYSPGYVHVDITQIYSQEGKLYLFVAIDRTTKFCFTRIYKDQTARTAVTFLQEMQIAFPNLMHKILTDNGLQFTHYKGEKSEHIFTKTCRELGIEHRTTQPYHPWTNGQVERMNRTIKEATVKKFYYENHAVLQEHLHAFIQAYNYGQSLKTLDGLTPYEKVRVYLQSEKGKPFLNTNYKFTEPYTYYHDS